MPRSSLGSVDHALGLLHQGLSAPHRLEMLAPEWARVIELVPALHRPFLEAAWDDVQRAGDGAERNRLRDRIDAWNDGQFPTGAGFR